MRRLGMAKLDARAIAPLAFPLSTFQQTPEAEAGIEAALESYRQGRVVDAARARAIIDAALGR